METTSKEVYYKILKLLKKHKELIVFDVNDLEIKSKLHLFGLELKEKYGLDIDPKRIDSFDWIGFGSHRTIGRWGEKHNRTISWPDDGKQPDDELLLQISFSTGAYIFGQDYPVELFQKFFFEFMSYNPKYVDTRNNNLYYSLDNAKDIFNNFDAILKKYHEINKEDMKQRTIKKMKEDLAKLEGK
jgi:hypothetical protein